MKTIRNYLQEISNALRGADYVTTKVLNECEVAAKTGAKAHTTSLPNIQAPTVVNYLIAVAKLDVYTVPIGTGLTSLQISWKDGE